MEIETNAQYSILQDFIWLLCFFDVFFLFVVVVVLFWLWHKHEHKKALYCFLFSKTYTNQTIRIISVKSNRFIYHTLHVIDTIFSQFFTKKKNIQAIIFTSTIGLKIAARSLQSPFFPIIEIGNFYFSHSLKWKLHHLNFAPKKPKICIVKTK